MKRVIAILLSVLVLLFVFVACGDETTESSNNTTNSQPTENSGSGSQGGGEGTHTHTYKIGAEWMSDATGHWYEVTCECEDAEIVLDHTDANNDGNCDVCGYTEHEHEYSEEWTADCTNHWHAADCGHIVAGTDISAHTDANNDGECDECKYVIEDLHTHYYSTEWSFDAQYHWHAALCEHGAEVIDRNAHTINDTGYCTECNALVNEIDKTDLLAILKAAVASNGKVVTGNVVASQTVYDSPVGAANVIIGSKLTNEVYYVLGVEDSYIFYKSFDKNDKYIGGNHQFYETLENGNIFGAQMLEGDYVLTPCQGAAQFLSGYNYTPGSILAAGYEDTTTLAITLFNLYDVMAKGEHVTNPQSSYNAETGVYAFSYTVYMVNASYEHEPGAEEGSEGTWNYQVELYNVDVEFTIDNNFVINLAEFSVEVFRNFEADMDLDYDPETDTVTLRDDASVTVYAYSVNQTSGERTYESIYPKKALVPTDFELFYVTEYNVEFNLEILAEELIEGTLTVNPDERIYLHLGNVTPKSSFPEFMDSEDFEVTYVNTDGKNGRLWDEKGHYTAPDFTSFSRSIAFNTFDSGSYEITIRFGEVTKKINIVVNVVEYVVPPSTDEVIYALTTDTYNYEKDTFTYTSTAAGVYKFAVPSKVGIRLEGESEPLVDIYDEPNNRIAAIEFEENETKTFYIAAEKKGVWTINVGLPMAAIEIPDNLPTKDLDLSKTTQVGPDSSALVYTATSSGTLEIKFGSASVKDVFYFVSINDGEDEAVEVNTTKQYYLAIGDTLKITAITKGGYSTIKGSFALDMTEGAFANPFALNENNTCEFAGGNGYIFYSYTPSDYGTLAITMSGDNFRWAYGYSEGELDKSVTDMATAEIEVAKDVTVYIAVATKDNNAGTVEFSAIFTSTEVPAVEKSLLIGENIVEDVKVNYSYTTDSDTELTVTFTVTSGNATATYSVNGAEAIALVNGEAANIPLNSGDELVISVENSGNATITATEKLGSKNNPIIIDFMPYNITVQGKHNVFYSLTATVDIVVTITAHSDCYVTNSAEVEKDINGNYVFSLSQGETVTFNAWTDATEDVEYTYAITSVADEAPGSGGGGGSDELPDEEW